MSKKSVNNPNEFNSKNSMSFGTSLDKNNLSGSEPQLVPDTILLSDEENISENIINYGTNSYSFSEKNELFQSLVKLQNKKNKEFSLLYLINTFGKSYSSESNEKNKAIIDLPKISKKLFSKPQPKSSSSKNLDNYSFKNKLPIKKSFSKGGIMNNFFSSIYEKQMSSSKLIDINTNGQKSMKNKRLIFNSGNKSDKLEISPFGCEKYRFGNLFNDNKEGVNLDKLKDKKVISNKGNEIKNKEFNSSLLRIKFGDELNNDNIIKEIGKEL